MPSEPHLLQVVHEDAETLVQVLAEFANLARILRDMRLAPAIGDDLEQRHERGGRGDDDALLERGIDQIGFLGERRRQELIARQEQHREFRAVFELLPVTFLAELTYSLFDLLRMPDQRVAWFIVRASLASR